MSFDAALNTTNGYYDISIDGDGDIATQESFETALLMSIFCERRALPSEVATPNLRRGWIGNDGFEIGSKSWLYEQARINRSTMNGVNTSANNGLKWLIDDKLLASISATSTVTESALGLTISLSRFNSPVEYRYYNLWSNTGVN